MSETYLFTCIVLGLVVGVASSFLAIGGGIIIVPALIAFLGLTRHQSVATSLVIISFVSLTNAIRFHRKGLVEVRLGLLLGGFSAFSAFVCGFFGTRASSDSLAWGFVVALSLIAVQSFRGEKTKTAQFLAKKQRSRVGVASVIGTVAGFAAAFTGVSGGVIMAPYVQAANWMENKKVVPTITLAMFLTSLAGSTSYLVSSASVNFIKFNAAVVIFAAAVVSSTLGQKYQHRLSARTRGWLLGTLLLALIAETLYQIFAK